MSEQTTFASPFEALGGEDAIRAFARRFYELMSTRPEAAGIRAMHADDLEPVIDRFATYLIGWMGGPRLYQERFGSIIVPAAHRPFPIGEDERDAWLLCFETALGETRVDAHWHETIMKPMRAMAEMCRTR